MKNSLFLLAAGAALASAGPLVKANQFSDSDGNEYHVVQEVSDQASNGAAPPPPIELDSQMEALIKEAVGKELSGGKSNSIELYVPDATVSPTPSNVLNSSKQTAKPTGLGNSGSRTIGTSREQDAGTGGQSNRTYLEILNQIRREMGKKEFKTVTLGLEEDSCATSRNSRNGLQHSNHANQAEVIGEGNDFEDVFLNWTCEIPSLLKPGECERRIKIKSTNISPDATGHARIVSDEKYKQVGCCSASKAGNTAGPTQVWTCNFK